MRSIEKLSQEEKELKVLIGSLKNVFTDVPFDFMWDEDNNSAENDEEFIESSED